MTLTIGPRPWSVAFVTMGILPSLGRQWGDLWLLPTTFYSPHGHRPIGLLPTQHSKKGLKAFTPKPLQPPQHHPQTLYFASSPSHPQIARSPVTQFKFLWIFEPLLH